MLHFKYVIAHILFSMYGVNQFFPIRMVLVSPSISLFKNGV